MERIKENSIVQITETGQQGWVGCLLQVSEVKAWGVLGWVQIPMQGSAYLRINFEDLEYIGEAVMIEQDSGLDIKTK